MLTQKVRNWGASLSADDFDEADVIITLLDLDEEHVHRAEDLAVPRGDDDVAYSFLVDLEDEEVVGREKWRPSHEYKDRVVPNRVRPAVGQRVLTIHLHEPMTNMGRDLSEPSVLVTAVKPTLSPEDHALLDVGVPRGRVPLVKTAFHTGSKYRAAETAILGLNLPLEEEMDLYDAVVEIFS
jgi:hypothetical protein